MSGTLSKAPTRTPSGTLHGTPRNCMKAKIIKPKISFPSELLKKVDRLAKKAGMDRSKYVCAVIEAKMFADEMKAAYGESN
jgi:hypothetical protein